MKVSTFSKAGLSLATAATLALGLGVTAANATGTPLTADQEDPTASTNLGGAGVGQYTLVGVGSDTIQDVEYGISQDLGTYTGPDGSTQLLNLASWTATGTTGLTYRSGGVAPAHPNGSGAGYKALSESIGRISGGSDNVGIGDVDYSRASGFQGTESRGEPSGYVTTAGSGVVTEIPFAVDAISFAAPAGSPFLKTNGNKGLTLADLANIYSGTDTYVDTVDGTLLTSATNPAAPTDATQPIQAFLPKPGSGSRQFFLQQLSKITGSPIVYNSNKDDDLFTNAYPVNTGPGSQVVPYIGAQMPDGSAVQEHDAAVLGAAPAGVAAIAPFSAAKFIGYHNGVIADPSGMTAGTGYVLVPFDSASTATGCPATGAYLPYKVSGSTYAPNPDYKACGSEGN
ncbi:MAG: hypothetical protein ACTHJM_04405, partial [Marmoricola sp.]